MQDYPWLAPTGVSAHLPNFVALQQGWIASLYEIPQFKTLNANRPDLLTIKVQTVKREMQNTRVLPSEKVKYFRRELIDVIEKLWQTGESEPLKTAIEERLQKLTLSDPQKILVGLISLLPQPKRAGYFKTSFENQIQMLRQEPDLSDAVIQAQFQAEIHHLGDVPNTRDALLTAVTHLVKEESELISLLRAKLAMSVIDRDSDLVDALEENDIKQAVKIVGEAHDECFDVAAENEAGYTERFLKSLGHGWTGATKEERGLVAKYLERVFKAMKNEERVLEAREVPVAHDLFTIQEIIPELGVYRGILGGDCSTTHSFAFPFSPLERVFLIFDKNGAPMHLYFAGTILQTNRTPTFYLHDIAGPALTKEVQGIVLHALWETREQFGTKHMTLPTRVVREANAGEEPSKSPRIMALIEDLESYIGEQVNQKYLDTDVRQFLGQLPGSAYDYDSPEFNAQAHLFVPRKGMLDGLQVVVVGHEPKVEEKPEEPLSPKDVFLRLLDLLAGEEKPEMFFDDLGIERAETERILALVNNAAHMRLDAYYKAMRTEFATHGIELSEKYMRKHSRYFLLGHLNAEDACLTDDQNLKDRTVQFTIETIRRGRVRDFAYDLVAKHHNFFNQNQEFQEYVSSIPLRGEDHLLRVERLLAGGVDPSLISWNVDRVTNVIAGNFELLQYHAIRWFMANDANANSPQYLALLAKALHNEKHKSDETSLIAVTQLLKVRTNDAGVNKSLLATVKHDENVQIAYRAAIALIENGDRHKKAHALLAENQNNQKIPKDLLAHGNRLLADLGPIDCAAEVANKEAKKK